MINKVYIFFPESGRLLVVIAMMNLSRHLVGLVRACMREAMVRAIIVVLQNNISCTIFLLNNDMKNVVGKDNQVEV